MRRIRSTFAAILIIPALAGDPPPSAAQQAKKSDPAKAEAVETVDPRGEPKAAAIKSIPGPKVCLAYEQDGWQVQIRPGSSDWTRIDGSIEVIGGEIARVSGFADLETSSRGGKNEHVDQGKFDKRHIDFKIWVTKGGTDTFRFYVSDPAQTIRFRFRVGGQATSELVLIGKEGKRPSRAEFSLDAHPERKPAG